jgi:hypothetical protein
MLGVLWIAAIGALITRVDASITLGFFAVLTPLTLITYAISNLLSKYLPSELVTVADVVHTIAPIEISAYNAGERLIVQQHVLEEVRRITSKQLGLNMNDVLASSRFVEDLKLD